MKGEGEREWHTQVKAEFHRTRKDKNAFLNEQCRGRGKQQNGKDQRSLEENWRYQGNNFIARMDTIKNRNIKNITEEIKKWWQEYTEALYKNALNSLHKRDGCHSPKTQYPGV